MACDVLGVQEGASEHRMRALAQALNIHVAAFPTPTAYPVGVFTRFPIVETRSFVEAGVRSNEIPYSRSAGAAWLEMNERLVWVVNLHAHPHRAELRSAEAEILGQRLDELLETSADVIVLGDFNSPVGTPLHETLRRRGFVNTMEAVGGGVTYTVTNKQGEGLLAIDHIYVSPSLAGHLVASRVISDPGFRLQGPSGPGIWVHSDHLPVEAVLKLP